MKGVFLMHFATCRVFMLMVVVCIANQLFGQEDVLGPGNPPTLLVVSKIDDLDRLEIVSYRTTYVGFSGESYNSRSVMTIDLTDVEITNIAGQQFSREKARELIKKEMPILAMSWREPIAKNFASLFNGDTLVFTFPGEAPKWKLIQEPGRPVK